MQVSLGGNRNSLTTHYSTCRYSGDQMQGTCQARSSLAPNMFISSTKICIVLCICSVPYGVPCALFIFVECCCPFWVRQTKVLFDSRLQLPRHSIMPSLARGLVPSQSPTLAALEWKMPSSTAPPSARTFSAFTVKTLVSSAFQTVSQLRREPSLLIAYPYISTSKNREEVHV